MDSMFRPDLSRKIDQHTSQIHPSLQRRVQGGNLPGRRLSTPRRGLALHPSRRAYLGAHPKCEAETSVEFQGHVITPRGCVRSGRLIIRCYRQPSALRHLCVIGLTNGKRAETGSLNAQHDFTQTPQPVGMAGGGMPPHHIPRSGGG